MGPSNSFPFLISGNAVRSMSQLQLQFSRCRRVVSQLSKHSDESLAHSRSSRSCNDGLLLQLCICWQAKPLSAQVLGPFLHHEPSMLGAHVLDFIRCDVGVPEHALACLWLHLQSQKRSIRSTNLHKCTVQGSLHAALPYAVNEAVLCLQFQHSQKNVCNVCSVWN